jgi:hypothetical protein
MAVIKAEGMSVEKMMGDGNCLFWSLSDQLFKDVGKKHKLVQSEVCNYLSEHIEWLRGFLADDIDINEYTNKMQNDIVWGGRTRDCHHCNILQQDHYNLSRWAYKLKILHWAQHEGTSIEVTLH